MRPIQNLGSFLLSHEGVIFLQYVVVYLHLHYILPRPDGSIAVVAVLLCISIAEVISR